MKGYSATRVFTPHEQNMLYQAELCVYSLPEDDKLRCHELARAIGRVLKLDHQDGLYCAVDHTWLIVRTGVHRRCILDVYCVGRLPVVQLIEVQSVGLGHRALYVDRPERTDINEHQVEALVQLINRGGMTRASM